MTTTATGTTPTVAPDGGVTVPVTIPAPDLTTIQQALAGGGYANGGGGGNLAAFGPVQMFATGGQFTVGGSGSTDSQHFGSFMATPGEIVSVRRPGDTANDNAEVVAELKALRAETAQLRQQLARHGDATIAATERAGKGVEKAVKAPTTPQLAAGGRAR